MLSVLFVAAPPGVPGALVWMISLLGAGTVGAFAMKLLDVFLFDRWTQKREFRNWFRGRRADACLRFVEDWRGLQYEGDQDLPKLIAKQTPVLRSLAALRLVLHPGEPQKLIREAEGAIAAFHLEILRCDGKPPQSFDEGEAVGKACGAVLECCREAIHGDHF